MASRDESTPAVRPEPPSEPPLPDGWNEEDLPLREVFLIYLSEEDAIAARRLAATAYLTILEADVRLPKWTESVQATEMRAVAKDLRFMQGYLTWLGRDNELHGLAPEEAKLSLLAADLVPRVAGLALELEHALTAPAAA